MLRKKPIQSVLTVAALLGVATANASPLAQWSAADGGNDHWYQIMPPRSLSWNEARDAAQEAGGYLATPTSNAENQFVFSLSDDARYWIIASGRATGPRLGGFQPDPDVPASQGWAWVTGEMWSYANWDVGEPNDFGGSEDALGYANNSTNITPLWNDGAREPVSERSYAVEYDTLPDIDGDGIDELSDNCQFIANPDQIDADGDGIGNACDADLNNDCVVNALDLALFRVVFFTTDPVADFNGDGVVNPLDLGIMRVQFFAPPGPSTLPNDCG